MADFTGEHPPGAPGATLRPYFAGATELLAQAITEEEPSEAAAPRSSAVGAGQKRSPAI